MRAGRAVICQLHFSQRGTGCEADTLCIKQMPRITLFMFAVFRRYPIRFQPSTRSAQITSSLPSIFRWSLKHINSRVQFPQNTTVAFPLQRTVVRTIWLLYEDLHAVLWSPSVASARNSSKLWYYCCRGISKISFRSRALLQCATSPISRSMCVQKAGSLSPLLFSRRPSSASHASHHPVCPISPSRCCLK